MFRKKHVCISEIKFHLFETQNYICLPQSAREYQDVGYIFKWLNWKRDKIKILKMNILKRGKKQDISNWYLASQEGNRNIKKPKIENLEIILLCSVRVTRQEAHGYCLLMYSFVVGIKVHSSKHSGNAVVEGRTTVVLTLGHIRMRTGRSRSVTDWLTWLWTDEALGHYAQI